MNCPNCGATMRVVSRSYSDECTCECGLSGPRGVLDALARRLDAYRETSQSVEEVFGEIVSITGYAGKEGDVFALLAHIRSLKSPAVVLAEAERLLRVYSEDVSMEVWLDAGNGASINAIAAATLAEAYAKLTGGSDV